MDYKVWVLEKLLAKYEASKAFASGIFSKRIAIDVKKEVWLQDSLEHPDEKLLFLSALDFLKDKHMIDYSWEKYEKGNLVEKIWLIPEEAAIEACYQSLHRIPKKNLANKLAEQIQNYRNMLPVDCALCRFFNEMITQIEKNHQIPRFFTDNSSLNEDILKGLTYIEQNQDEIMERLLSSKLYDGDSKYFERNVKAKVISVLKYLKKKEDEEILEDDELLREKGVVRWPEILEFTGKITAVLEDGETVDFSAQKYGAYVNSETVRHIKEVMMSEVRQITFIENKANYIWYISHIQEADELVVYHGGFYSPIKGIWFQKLYEGSKRQQRNVTYLHWSDIDVGGFHIFFRLNRNIVPELQPYKMDEKTLLRFKESAAKIQSESYRSKLQEMAVNTDYMKFWKVIQTMLTLDIRLEQENIIV